MTHRDHPYRNRPDYAYWRRSVAEAPAGELDPFVSGAFTIGRRESVATAGSCFAQHIGRYLKAGGSNYMVTEAPHPVLTDKGALAANYGVFSARYGNIYTARQLVQLFDRAYGRFAPREDVWQESGRVFVDPFRPNIQRGGFNSEREFHLDRERHFRAVREMFENMDVFVFTLGLTEAWRSKADGAIFPVCPGVAGGTFSADNHEFINFGVDDVAADMRDFIAKLTAVNRRVRIILTVSPVPLAATAENRHVLVSTIYSKSVLRVVCDMLARALPNVVYFPSYEIIASGHAGHYFADDQRTIREEGVAHVMRVFARHFLTGSEDSALFARARRTLDVIRGAESQPPTNEAAALEAAFKAMCDEEALDRPFD
ncbi:MAG: GSCFA domain-containing protein [Hyphomicrobiales bacterium]|nr:GSCFA domain-containing protein [Hyphomicrobiales bacterium]